jgi:hypothetical protein
MFLLMFAMVAATATSAMAAPIVFVGGTQGANTLAGAANAVAAHDAFVAAAGALNTIDFESAPLGNIANTPLGGGVSIDDFGTGWLISNDSGGSGSLFGLNTTPGGSYFATSYPNFSGGKVVFNFSTPVSAFGAYFGGLQGSSVGQQTIRYTSGGVQTINIPMLASGIAFAGFIDAGASISSIEVDILADFVTIDDVMYSSRASAPEPSVLLLFGAAAGMAARYRRRRAA